MRTGTRRLLATALTGLALLGGVAPGQAAPGAYTGSVDTTCQIAEPTVSAPSTRPVVEVTIGAVGNLRPVGRVDVVYRHNGRPLHQQGADYDGGTVRLTGPSLHEAGRYSVQVRYRPKGGSVFASCRATRTLARVGTAVSPADGTHHGHHGHHGHPSAVANANGQAPTAAAAGPDAAAAADPSHHGLLPNTGSPVTMGIVVLAGTLLALGLLLMSTRWRPRRRTRLRW